MDWHDVGETTAEAVAAAHMEDLRLPAKHGCRAVTYWHDETRGTVFCLYDAPEADAVEALHRESHRLMPSEIMAVELSEVAAFLGSLSDPEDAHDETPRESAFRVIMFTDMVDSTELTNRRTDWAMRRRSTCSKRITASSGGAWMTMADGRSIARVTASWHALTQRPTRSGARR